MGNWREAIRQPAIAKGLEKLKEALELTYDVLKLSLSRSQILDAAFERIHLVKGKLARLMDVSIAGYSYWYECSKYHFSLNITPLSVAEKFHEQMTSQPGAWIFTSATLAVNDSFDHFNSRLGLFPKKTLCLPSPFNFEKQAILCVPRYLPPANGFGTAETLSDLMLPVIEQNQGRCFFLCTSHVMVRELSRCFREKLSLPVLMQGEASKQQLLAEFLKLGNALLVATGAFWEGIDVRGQALSCVIIDKLPFTSPEDPLLKARIEDCQLRGGDPFREVQIPDAVITLKQGVGRLIRDTADQGALIICDSRLVSRDYGQLFLQSLPPIPRTRDLNQVREFLSRMDEMHVQA